MNYLGGTRLASNYKPFLILSYFFVSTWKEERLWRKKITGNGCLNLWVGDSTSMSSSEFQCVLVGDDPRDYVVLLNALLHMERGPYDGFRYYDHHQVDGILDGKPYCLDLIPMPPSDDYARLRPLSYPNTNLFVFCHSLGKPDALANIRSKWIPEVMQTAAENSTPSAHWRAPCVLIGLPSMDGARTPVAAARPATELRVTDGFAADAVMEITVDQLEHVRGGDCGTRDGLLRMLVNRAQRGYDSAAIAKRWLFCAEVCRRAQPAGPSRIIYRSIYRSHGKGHRCSMGGVWRARAGGLAQNSDMRLQTDDSFDSLPLLPCRLCLKGARVDVGEHAGLNGC